MPALQAIRWTRENAASEFGLNPRTLGARIRQSGVVAGEDGRYSTLQICSAVFGDIDGEKLRLTREQADKVALENAERRQTLVDAKEFRRIVERGMAAMITAIQTSANLEDTDKERIVNHLREVGEAVAGVSEGAEAAAQIHSESVVGEVPVSEPGILSAAGAVQPDQPAIRARTDGRRKRPDGANSGLDVGKPANQDDDN